MLVFSLIVVSSQSVYSIYFDAISCSYEVGCPFGMYCNYGSLPTIGVCEPNWDYTDWSKCMPTKNNVKGFGFIQTRACVDLNGCDEVESYPVKEQSYSKVNKNYKDNSRLFRI